MWYRTLTPVLVVAVALLAGCSSAPRRGGEGPVADPVIVESGAETLGTQIARIAIQFFGTPYRYGGDNPRGFDCSGLVFYSHQRAGLEVPRTAADQSRAARPVPYDALRPGDLVFFKVRSRRVDHVGIYLGAGRFIHAPSSGRTVTYAYLEDPYYQRRLSGAGRFW